MTADFSRAIIKSRRQWDNIFNMLKKNKFCLRKHKNKNENTFSGKQNLRVWHQWALTKRNSKVTISKFFSLRIPLQS